MYFYRNLPVHTQKTFLLIKGENYLEVYLQNCFEWFRLMHFISVYTHLHFVLLKVRHPNEWSTFKTPSYCNVSKECPFHLSSITVLMLHSFLYDQTVWNLVSKYVYSIKVRTPYHKGLGSLVRVIYNRKCWLYQSVTDVSRRHQLFPVPFVN